MQFLTDMMRNAPLVYYWCMYIVQLYIRHVLVSHYRNIWIRTIWQKLSSDTQYWLFITMKETYFLVGQEGKKSIPKCAGKAKLAPKLDKDE